MVRFFNKSDSAEGSLVRESVDASVLLWRASIERSTNKNPGNGVPLLSGNLYGAEQPSERSLVERCASKMTTCLKSFYVFAEKRTRCFNPVVGLRAACSKRETSTRSIFFYFNSFLIIK